MTAETNESMTTGVDGFFDKLNEVTTLLTDKMVDVSPEIVETLLNLVQAKSGFNLILGCFLTIPLMVFWFNRSRVSQWVEDKERTQALDNKGGYVVLSAFLGFCAVMASIFGVVDILAFSNWLGVFYPEGALALKALEAAGINL